MFLEDNYRVHMYGKEGNICVGLVKLWWLAGLIPVLVSAGFAGGGGAKPQEGAAGRQQSFPLWVQRLWPPLHHCPPPQGNMAGDMAVCRPELSQVTLPEQNAPLCAAELHAELPKRPRCVNWPR